MSEKIIKLLSNCLFSKKETVAHGCTNIGLVCNLLPKKILQQTKPEAPQESIAD